METVKGKITLMKNGPIIVRCPFCFDSYKKNGLSRKNAKNKIHEININDCIISGVPGKDFVAVTTINVCDSNRFFKILL